MVKKANVVPGAVVKVRKNQKIHHYDDWNSTSLDFQLDGHLVAYGKATLISVGEVLTVLTKPRKVNGVNLVRVRTSGGVDGEVFYIMINSCCDLIT